MISVIDNTYFMVFVGFIMTGTLISLILTNVYDKKLDEKGMSKEYYDSIKNIVEISRISLYVFAGIAGLVTLYFFYEIYLMYKSPVVPPVYQHTNSIVTHESFFRPDATGIARAKSQRT
jgi:hypothetical protein